MEVSSVELDAFASIISECRLHCSQIEHVVHAEITLCDKKPVIVGFDENRTPRVSVLIPSTL